MKKKIIQIIAFISAMFCIMGCSKTVECDITQQHAHIYKKDGELDKLISSEKESIRDYKRTEEYKTIDDQEKELIKFENNHGLFRISENLDLINEITTTQKDQMEYRYYYIYRVLKSHTSTIGKSKHTYFRFERRIGYNWTTDINQKNLTGEERMVYTVFTAYKIVIDAETGKRVIIESEPEDNFNNLPHDYTYVKNNFYKKVDANGKEVSYEDGPESDHKLTEEQQKQYEEQQNNKEGKIQERKLRF